MNMVQKLLHLLSIRRTAIVQGTIYGATQDINMMNRRAKLSHLKSPWAYNRPGWADIEYVDYDGPEDDYELDYDVKGLVFEESVPSEEYDPWKPENWGWEEADLEYLNYSAIEDKED